MGKRDDNMNRQPSFITGIIPVRRRCALCKKRRVKNHHKYCDRCHRMKHMLIHNDKSNLID
jgi:hypothetical protein